MKTTTALAFLTQITLLWSLGPDAAHAVPVRVDVTGSVSQVDGPFFPLISFGEPMSGYFIYDAELVTRRTSFGVERVFYYGPVIEYQLRLGNILATGQGGRIEVTNDHTDVFNRFWDRIIIQSGGVSEPNIPLVEAAFETDSLSVGFSFYDYDDANAIDSSDLPSSLPLGSLDIDRSHVSIQAIPTGNGEWEPVFATITTVSLQVIPEPSSLLLGALAAVGLLMRRRRLS